MGLGLLQPLSDDGGNLLQSPPCELRGMFQDDACVSENHNRQDPDKQPMHGKSNAELTYDVAPPPSALIELTTCMHMGVCCAHSSTELRHQAEEVTSVKREGQDLQTRQSTPGCSGWRQGLAGSWLWPS